MACGQPKLRLNLLCYGVCPHSPFESEQLPLRACTTTTPISLAKKQPEGSRDLAGSHGQAGGVRIVVQAF